MPQYFKPSDYIQNPEDKVRIQVTGKHPQKETQYGVVTPVDIIVKGQEMVWDLDLKKQKQIKDSGCGATFWIIGWKTKYGSIGYNYAPEGDVSVNADTQTEIKEPQKSPEQLRPSPEDDYAKKVNRGASLNLAGLYEMYRACGGTLGLEEWWKEVASNADLIAPLQKDFVNGRQVVSGEPPAPEPPPEDYEYKDDLPF